MRLTSTTVSSMDPPCIPQCLLQSIGLMALSTAPYALFSIGQWMRQHTSNFKTSSDTERVVTTVIHSSVRCTAYTLTVSSATKESNYTHTRRLHRGLSMGGLGSHAPKEYHNSHKIYARDKMDYVL